MSRLLLCTDLDRTLLPNGPQAESPGARAAFAALARRSEVTLAYVSGRGRELVAQAIADYALPLPGFVVADVGTAVYAVDGDGGWTPQADWTADIGRDWAEVPVAALAELFRGLPGLRLQEPSRQTPLKLSYYAPPDADAETLLAAMRTRLAARGACASLVWSVDEAARRGLLDVLPARATKLHAIEYLMARLGFGAAQTLFAGDSGNDLEPLASAIPAVLVANCHPRVRQQALRLSAERGHPERLYCARGGFLGMNGNYSAGVLEGVAHFHPETVDWFAAEAVAG